ncbi:MAG: flippase-like domain-containing protein [Myxococcales bacterium]|nr:flippase-like domain-containing protein [Myxococcales bacterium]
MSGLRRWLGWIAPFVISGGAFAFLLTKVDARAVLESVPGSAARVGLPALAIYGAVSLWIEALSLTRLVGGSHAGLGRWTCARIKAASYPLQLIHYGLGGAALAVLIRRRSGLALSDAAGVVVTIAMLDLAMLLLLAGAGAALLATQAPALRAGVIGVVCIGIVGGGALLRAPVSLGPFERIRSLSFFRALRTTPWRTLLAVGGLRLAFVTSFIGLGWTLLAAFEIRIPLGDFVVGFAAVALIAALPIAVSGLGTGQLAFVEIFQHWAEPAALLAYSLTLSLGLILLRAGIGLVFARELTREALASTREGSS